MWGSGGVSPCILFLGTRWEWVGVTHQPIYLWRNYSLHQMKKKAEWTREAVWIFLSEKSLSCGEWNQVLWSSSSCAHCAISVAVKYTRTIKMLSFFFVKFIPLSYIILKLIYVLPSAATNFISLANTRYVYLNTYF
jgi:hypothetical protein